MLNKVVLHSCSSVTPLMSTEFLDVALIYVLNQKNTVIIYEGSQISRSVYLWGLETCRDID